MVIAVECRLYIGLGLGGVLLIKVFLEVNALLESISDPQV